MNYNDIDMRSGDGHQSFEFMNCLRPLEGFPLYWWDGWAYNRDHVLIMAHVRSRVSGWWFGTFFIFPDIGNNHPNWLIFFSEGLKPPTSHSSFWGTPMQDVRFEIQGGSANLLMASQSNLSYNSLDPGPQRLRRGDTSKNIRSGMRQTLWHCNYLYIYIL